MNMIYILLSGVGDLVYIEWNLYWRSPSSGDVGTDTNGYFINLF